jgi:hypothetical protein
MKSRFIPCAVAIHAMEEFSCGAVSQLKPIHRTQQDMGSCVYESGTWAASQAGSEDHLQSISCTDIQSTKGRNSLSG